MDETEICLAIASAPEKIGYPGAVALNQVHIGEGSGYVDLVLLPRPESGGKALVLVEAKCLKNKASLAGLVGQSLKSYTNALAIGRSGLDCVRAFAARGVPVQAPFLVPRRFIDSLAPRHAPGPGTSRPPTSLVRSDRPRGGY